MKTQNTFGEDRERAARANNPIESRPIALLTFITYQYPSACGIVLRNYEESIVSHRIDQPLRVLFSAGNSMIRIILARGRPGGGARVNRKRPRCEGRSAIVCQWEYFGE